MSTALHLMSGIFTMKLALSALQDLSTTILIMLVPVLLPSPSFWPTTAASTAQLSSTQLPELVLLAMETALSTKQHISANARLLSSATAATAPTALLLKTTGIPRTILVSDATILLSTTNLVLSVNAHHLLPMSAMPANALLAIRLPSTNHQELVSYVPSVPPGTRPTTTALCTANIHWSIIPASVLAVNLS